MAVDRLLLESYSVAQLRRYARDAGYSSITRLTTKDSLIPAILTQQQKDRARTPPDGVPVNPSVAPAMAAKVRLEALGWTCKGRGYVHRGQSGTEPTLRFGTRTWSNMDVQLAGVLATRGDETLSLTWVDGECVEQTYSIFPDSRTALSPTKGLPAAVLLKRGLLGFEPDEMSDVELIKRLAGMKVTWWNMLGSSEESAVVSPMNKGVISVTHFYTTKGAEVTDGRSIQFIDAHGGGFKAFRLSALIKVGN
jgi:hypothetical protein